MNIAMVFDGLQIGGIERVGSDYAKILCDMGNKVTIINLRPKMSQMENEFPKQCEIVHFEYPKSLALESYSWMYDKGLREALIYPFLYILLIIINSLYKVYGHYIKKFNQEYDIVIAFAGHVNDLAFVSGGFVKSKKKMCWLHGALYSYLLMSRGYLRLYKKIKNLVVLVDDAQEEVLAYNRELNLNIRKLYNPTFIDNRMVDTNVIETLKKKYGKFAVMVSRFNYPHKDQYTVAEAIRIVREKYRDDINLVFVGDGPEEEMVKRAVDDYDDEVKKHIFFEGARSDVQNYYSAAYILLHASVAGEGLPTVILEAMMYELPTVVTDSKTGPREILKDSVYGLLCQVKDPEDMAEKIHRILNDGKLYKHLQKQGKRRINDFMPDKISLQLQGILSSL